MAAGNADPIRQVIPRADALAARFGTSATDTAHVLLALADDPAIAPALARLDVDAEDLQLVVAAHPPAEVAGGRTRARDLEQAIGRAEAIARSRGGRVTAGVLLHAVLDEPDFAAVEVLAALDVDPEQMLSLVAVEPDDDVLGGLAEDLTRAAVERRIDPVLGRSREVTRVVQVFAQRIRTIPVLVSDPGVDVRPVVDGLAWAMVEDDVVPPLTGRSLHRLDLRDLPRDPAGDPITDPLEDAARSGRLRTDCVVFVEDLAAVLRDDEDPTRRLIRRWIVDGVMLPMGAMTAEDVRDLGDLLPGLMARVQPVTVEAPTVGATIEILKGLRDRYEEHHRVTITDEALVAAANLAELLVRGEPLPDSATALIDAAGALQRAAAARAGYRDTRLDDELAAVIEQKKAAVEAQDFDAALAHRDREKELLTAREELERDLRADGVDLHDQVDEDTIAAALEEVHGIPRSRSRALLARWRRVAAGPTPGAHPFRLLNDQPVADARDDLLGSAQVATGIAALLAEVDSPFVMALEGGWGVGKSTLMNQIRRQLPETMPSTTFNAWTAQGENALEGLIKSVLTELDPRLVRRVTRSVLSRRRAIGLARIGSIVVARFFGIARVVDELWAQLEVDAQARNELRVVIGGMLEEWTKAAPNPAQGRLVVFVDDLDRCSNDVIVGVCEAVKLYLDGPGLVFVLACDLSVLARGVAGEARGGEGEGRAYLEKIIQVSHRVSQPDPQDIRRLIAGYAAGSGTSGLVDDTMVELLADTADGNPRRIKRILNSFVLEQHLVPAWSEPSLGSAALMTAVLLQHLAPALYEVIVTAPAGSDPIGDFLDCAAVFTHAGDPPARTDGWWTITNRVLARRGLRTLDRTTDRLDARTLLDDLPDRLPPGFAEVARDRRFVRLVEDIGDSETRRAVHAQLVSRPLSAEPDLDPSSSPS